MNSWIGKQSVEFRGPCGIASGQVIVLLKEARGVVHTKAKVLQDPDPSGEFLLLKGTRWRCQADAVTCAQRWRTYHRMEGHLHTLRCCGEILRNHAQGMLGNLLLNGLSITGKLCFFCVHTGWRPHGKARAPQWLR